MSRAGRVRPFEGAPVPARLRLLPPTSDRTKPLEPDAPTADRLRALRARDSSAERWLIGAHWARVERILFRILGDVRHLEDLTQEVFVRVFARIEDVTEPESLRPFVTSVTVFVAREAIRKARRHRWLSFLAPEDLPDVGAGDDDDAREALAAFYRIVRTLDPDERVAFTLRFVEGLELSAVAAACGVSLATIKRRLARAETRFIERCRGDEALRPWLEEGDRWA